jgi:glycosyltransferase involved in cell wall biosynthesis
MRIAVVTYFYPNAIAYVAELVASINQQVDQDFSLVIFNDGVKEVHSCFQKVNVPVFFYEGNGNPLAIRIQSFSILKKLDFDGYVFLDADDGMSSNRVREAKLLLGEHSIVVNDLTLSNVKGEIISTSIWSSRLPNGFTITPSFLRDKNVIGFGNTSVNRQVLDTSIVARDVLAADWYIFYQLMEKRQLMAIFTSRCQTIYRQHENNVAGISALTSKKWAHIRQVKQSHYAALQAEGYDFTREIHKLANSNKGLAGEKREQTKLDINPFWWEEIEKMYE